MKYRSHNEVIANFHRVEEFKTVINAAINPTAFCVAWWPKGTFKRKKVGEDGVVITYIFPACALPTKYV